MPDIRLQKAELRARLRLPREQTNRAAEDAVARLKDLQKTKPDLTVFCYFSMPGEVPTAPIFNHCHKENIPLAIPRCTIDGMQMTARLCDVRQPFELGAYGIPVPPADAPILENPTVVIVPGFGFDADNNRIGRGGGYFDRWLRENTYTEAWGLCPAGGFFRQIPHEENDIKMTLVIRNDVG